MNPRMQQRHEALCTRIESTLEEVRVLEDRWGEDRSKWPKGQAERWTRLRASVERLGREVEDLQDQDARIERVRAAAMDPANIEHGTGCVDHGTTGVATRRRSDPWAPGSGNDLGRLDTLDGLSARAHDAIELAAGIPHDGRVRLANAVDAGAREDGDRDAAAFVLAGLSPHYRTAFEKVIRDPQRGHLLWDEPEREAYARVESHRAAMSLTGANGGFLVPFTLDPSVVLTNTSTANPYRLRARIETTTTNDWNGVTSAGVNAEWLAEGATAADASPTFARLTVPTLKAAAFLFGTYEVLGDSNVGEQIPTLLADAKDRIEETAFALGNGTTQPQGAIPAATALNSVSAGAFTIADVYALFAAAPARARRSPRFTALASVTTMNRIRQFDTAGGSSFWANVGSGMPPELLGVPIFESTSIVSTLTANSRILSFADLNDYVIVDRLGTTVLYDPMLKDPATGRPNGTGGWFAYWRVGARVANTASIRVLNIT